MARIDPEAAMADLMKRLTPLVEGVFPAREGEALDAYCDRVVESDLSNSQRAMIAAYLHEASRAAARERRVDRDAWVATARMVFVPSERQPCWVCGRFKSIAQAHHVVPLASQYSRGFHLPDDEHVWLCPTHHVMAHIFIQSDDRSLAHAALKARQRSVAALNPDLSEQEFEKMLDLMRRAGRGPEEK